MQTLPSQLENVKGALLQQIDWKGVALVASLFVFLVYLPFYAMLTIGILLAIMSIRMRSLRKPMALAIGVSFALANILKLPEGDLIAYFEYYELLKGMPFNEMLSFSFLNIRITEILFRAFVWSIANIFDEPVWFVAVATVLIYSIVLYFSIFFVECVFRNNRHDYMQLLYAVIWVCFIAITFSLTAHVTRQYLGFLVFLIGVVIALKGNHKAAFLVLLSSGLVHNATFMFVPLFYGAMLISRFSFRVWFAPGILLSALVLSSIVASISSYVPGLGDRGEAEAVGAMFALDALVIMSFLWFYRKEYQRPIIPKLYSFVFCYLSVLVVFRVEPLIFLRLYFFMDILRAVLGVLVIYKVSGESKTVMLPLAVFLFVAFFMFRMSSSPWDYGSAGESAMLVSFESVVTRLDTLY